MIRASKALRAKATSLVLRSVWLAMDWTVASVFFTRWLSSSIKRRCRCAARTASVRSIPWTNTPVMAPALSRMGL
ncbi:hypothetical protein D3C87_1881860 [compost metagenome]